MSLLTIFLLFVSKEQIPLDEVVQMLARQSPVYSEIILQMTEERLDAVGVVWYIGGINVLEHVRYGPVKMDVCPSDAVVSVCDLSGLLVDSLLLNELFIVLVPSVQFLYPIQFVVGGLDMAYLTHEPPQQDACRRPRVLREPSEALPFNVHDTALPDGIRIDISDGSDYVVASVRREAGYPQP